MDKWLKRNTTNNSSRDVQPSTSKGIENKSNKLSSDVQPSSEDKKAKTSWTRKYFDVYLKFGFISAGSDNQLPLCVICHATLSNECMKTLKLKRHLECKHLEYSRKPIYFLVNKKRIIFYQKKKHEKRTFYKLFQRKLGFGFIRSFEANSLDRLPAYYW
jgi:hypothetical protein